MLVRTCLLLSALFFPAAANAIVYSGGFEASVRYYGVGILRADYTITTDGTIGTLSPSNYIGYTVNINNNGLISQTSGTGVFAGVGTGGIATATELSFDFTQPGARLLLFNGNDGVCFVAPGGDCAGAPNPASVIYSLSTGATGYLPRANGVVVIAQTPTAAVPEPASWAMLIAGFGLVGAAARRRRISGVSASA